MVSIKSQEFYKDYPDATIRELCNFIQITASHDYTADTKFLGEYDKWCKERIHSGKINMIEGVEIGTKTVDEKQIIVDDLMSNHYLDLYPGAYGILIPSNEILNRLSYEWFARMSGEQIFQGNFILAKYFVLALAPDSKMGVIEPMATNTGDISFWQVPTSSTLPVFGPMPIGIGNNVSKFRL